MDFRRGKPALHSGVWVIFWPAFSVFYFSALTAEAFWELFKEYEDAGGNGYIHTVVQPAMNLLKVVDIEDAANVLHLTDSRK